MRITLSLKKLSENKVVVLDGTTFVRRPFGIPPEESLDGLLNFLLKFKVIAPNDKYRANTIFTIEEFWSLKERLKRYAK